MMHVSIASSRTIRPTKPVTFVPKNIVENPTRGRRSASTAASLADSQTSKFLEQEQKEESDHLIKSTPRGGGALSINGSEVKGAIIFTALDYLFRKAFTEYKIKFPSQLGGCCILFVTMLLAEAIKPGLGDAVFTSLSPGAGLLAKWLPVFFVPGLALLPLAPSMGSPLEILKVFLVVVVGFYYSCATTAYAVLGLRKWQGTATVSEVPQKSSGAAALPFSPELVDFLSKGLALSGAISIAASKMNNEYATILRTIFMTFATFFGYVWGARLPSAFTKIVHPLVISTAVTHVFTQLTALATSSTFKDVLGTYKSGTMKLLATGAGDILMYLLGPSVVSFAISMYSRKKVIADNLLVVLTGMIVASAGGLFGTAAMVRLLKIGGEAGDVLRKSILPRNVTTPLAIAITNIIKGDISQASAVVVFTGIFGATFGASFCTALGITDPVARGMGVGGSGQGLGVASMMSEKEAFPFAAVSMVLTAIGATTLMSIPAVADSVVKLALGK